MFKILLTKKLFANGLYSPEGLQFNKKPYGLLNRRQKKLASEPLLTFCFQKHIFREEAVPRKSKRLRKTSPNVTLNKPNHHDY